MKFLKSHISLILALVSILFSFEIYNIFNKIIKTYEKEFINEYSILIVTNKPIVKGDLRLDSRLVKGIEPIDISNSIINIKKKFKDIDINKLKQTMPHFYKVKLNIMPTPSQLSTLEASLKSYSFVTRVETFRQNQSKIYTLLSILHFTSKVFMLTISLIGIMLIVKQMRIWKFEHRERMEIMELFGAPVWFRSAALLKMAIFDSIIAIFITFLIVIIFLQTSIYQNFITQIGVDINLKLYKDIIFFIAISFSISFLSTLIVMVSKRND